MSTYDGSSLTGWTLSSSSGVVVDSFLGNPAPSIRVTGGNYAAINVTDAAIGRTEVRFDVRIDSSGAGLTNFAFFCDAGGAGTLVTFEARSTFPSGLETLTNWSTWSQVYAPFVDAHKNWSVATWYTFVMRTRMVGNQAQVQISQVIGEDEVLCLDWANFVPKGNWFALHNPAAGVADANWDNIHFDNLGVPVAGVAKLSSGAAATKVVFLDASTYFLQGQVTPGADGSYSLQINTGAYLVIAYGPDGYRPAAHLVTVS
jgi:hypothetical protein